MYMFLNESVLYWTVVTFPWMMTNADRDSFIMCMPTHKVPLRSSHCDMQEHVQLFGDPVYVVLIPIVIFWYPDVGQFWRTL